MGAAVVSVVAGAFPARGPPGCRPERRWRRDAAAALSDAPRLGAHGLGAPAVFERQSDHHGQRKRARPSHVYVALGENGRAAPGSRTNLRAAWTQIFYQSALGTTGTFYDFSMPDQTVADVLGQELAQALAVHPDLVTVWLSTADIVDGTDPATYGTELRQLVGALRRQGTTVLLANAVPPVALESAFDVCTRRFGGCSTAAPPPTSGALSPGLASAVTAYDDTIASVARQTGAMLVDVHSVLVQCRSGWRHPERPLRARSCAVARRQRPLVAARLRAQGCPEVPAARA